MSAGVRGRLWWFPEIAISLMLLVGAGLLLRSLVNLHRVTGGFSTPPRQILTMLISPGNQKVQ